MITRRRFLTGLGGVAVALPFLESVRWARRAAAAPPQTPVYSFFIRQGNGVQQAGFGGEPERFWPRDLGPLTRESLAGQPDRTLSLLADHAHELTLVRGTRFGFSASGCGHAAGLNQCLTAAQFSGSGAESLAAGPSIDWFIAERLNPPGVEPLTLMSGPQSAYIAHGLSYRGPGQLRGARNNPIAVYATMMGISGTPEALQLLAERRRSVNDLVRGELAELTGHPDLSRGDRQRLDMHFQAIRDLEVSMVCGLSPQTVQAMEELDDKFEANENRIVVADMMLELAALAFSCDANRTGTLQIGTGNDQTRYYVGGELQNTFHRISHRIDGDGSEGAPIDNADVLHHEIDRLFAGIFKRFLDRLAAYTGPSGGPLLDDSVVLWTNDLANGPPHSFDNIPQVLAGGAAGFLRTGRYIDAGGVTHNKLLNTLISAVGIRNEDATYYDRFGDSSLERGVITEMIA